VEPFELYRERAVLEGARATVAERRLWSVRAQLELLSAQIAWRDAELARLRDVVEAQARELASLRAQLAEARERSRQMSMLQVVEAVLAAVERGSLRLRDARLARFAAELKATFQVDDEEAGLVLGGAAVHAPDALSTVSFEVVPGPPSGERAWEKRFLGNSSSMELHDLDNPTPGCQLREIRPDRHVYFDTVEAAAEQGYDFCAYCFGREMSRR
jgi:hypothetical protein